MCTLRRHPCRPLAADAPLPSHLRLLPLLGERSYLFSSMLIHVWMSEWAYICEGCIEHDTFIVSQYIGLVGMKMSELCLGIYS